AEAQHHEHDVAGDEQPLGPRPATLHGAARYSDTARVRWQAAGRSCARALRDREAELAADDQPLDLARALADLEDLGVAVLAGDEGLVHEPVASEDLGGLPGGGDRGLGGVELGHGRLLLERAPRVAEAGGAVHESAG